MNLGIPKETKGDETRVAMSPEVTKKLVKKGFAIFLEAGAGRRAGFSDDAYVKEGAKVVSGDEALQQSVPSRYGCCVQGCPRLRNRVARTRSPHRLPSPQREMRRDL